MLIVEGKSFDKSQKLVDITSERKVIDSLVAYKAVFIDEKSASVGDAFARNENVVVSCYSFVDVRNEWVLDTLDAAVGFWCVQPSKVRELAVNRAADNFCV